MNQEEVTSQIEALTTMILALVKSHPDHVRLLATFEELRNGARFRTRNTRETSGMHPLHAAHHQLRIYMDEVV